MKTILRKIFSPILSIFESGEEPYAYKPSHRTILMVLGSLFSGLASAVFFLARGQDDGYFIPVIVFGSVGIISLLIGFIGTDRAVAKIWGSK